MHSVPEFKRQTAKINKSASASAGKSHDKYSGETMMPINSTWIGIQSFFIVIPPLSHTQCATGQNHQPWILCQFLFTWHANEIGSEALTAGLRWAHLQVPDQRQRTRRLDRFVNASLFIDSKTPDESASAYCRKNVSLFGGRHRFSLARKRKMGSKIVFPLPPWAKSLGPEAEILIFSRRSVKHPYHSAGVMRTCAWPASSS